MVGDCDFIESEFWSHFDDFINGMESIRIVKAMDMVVFCWAIEEFSLRHSGKREEIN